MELIPIVLFIARCFLIETIIETSRYVIYYLCYSTSPETIKGRAWWVINGLETLLVMALVYSGYNMPAIIVSVLCVMFAIQAGLKWYFDEKSS